MSPDPPPTPPVLPDESARLRELEDTVESLRADREYLLWRLEETERYWGQVASDLVNSASWRVTRPLRSATRLLRRRQG